MVALAFRFPVLRCSSSEELGFRLSGGRGGCVRGDGGFPSFLPKEIQHIRDPSARTLAQRIQRVPVQMGYSENCIMSSCVTPTIYNDSNPVVLLHCFDSSCLEWRSAYPLLEKAGLEAWAIDILGWGFSDLERRPSCNAVSKRNHLYQLWKSHVKRPMILVGPSLGAAVAIDFAVNFPEAVDSLVLINASVYAEGTGNMTKLPKPMAYAMASLLKSVPIRFYAKKLVFDGLPLSRTIDWMNVGRLHCLLPWWEDATVDFMLSGGYNVIEDIKQVKQKALVICSEHDKIVSSKFSKRLHSELPNAVMQKVAECGHLPHVEKPDAISQLIVDFARSRGCNGWPVSYLVDDLSSNKLHMGTTFKESSKAYEET
ncbi:alpha/beta-Hydrolases superfamily protein [Abeliophyllum distichum]|uniref:Alpha/beta-Hydrolases superfamily protein n=1 Tax=Abeliophyllum distichum TaxID=126358 RepID=A0ABD1SH11_9LAMI